MNSVDCGSDVPDGSSSGEELEDSTDECEDDDDVHVNPAEIVEEFESSVLEKGYEVVQDYYDVLDYIFRKTYSARDWRHRLSVMESLLKALDSLKISVTKFLAHSMDAEEFRTEKDSETASHFSDLLVMTTELIGFVIGICEDDFNSRFYASVAATEQSELEEIDNSTLQCYEILKKKALEAVHLTCTFFLTDPDGKLVQNAIRFLWRPAKVDEELLRIMVSVIVKLMENPKFYTKAARPNDLRELFLMLRTICTGLNCNKVVARLLVSATLEKKFKEKHKTMQKFPFIEVLLSVSVDGDLDHLLYYVYYFAMDSLHRWIRSEPSNAHIPNGYLLFIGAMAEHAPRIMAENIAPLVPLLDFDPSTLRGGILSAFCSVLISDMEKTRFSVAKQSMTIIRGKMMDEIQEHLSDSAIQIRTKAVGFCVEIARHGKIPENSLRKGLLIDIAERLAENSGIIRRAAIKFFKVFLANNPYEKNLSRSYLLSQLEQTHSLLLNHDDTLKQTAEKFFDSISPGLSRILKELIENNSSSLIRDLKLEETPTEKVMEMVKSLLFFPDSVRDALSAFLKLFYLGRFDNISREQPKTELVASLLAELRAQFLNVPKEVIGICDENANVVPSSQTDLSEEAHLITRRQRHLEDALCLHDQLCRLLPEVINSISGKDPADVSEAVDFLVECCHFSIRGSEAALLKLYRNVECISDVSKACVVNGIASLFVIRKKNGKTDVEATALSLLKRLKRVDECGCYAVENLLSVLSQQGIYPSAVSSILFHVVEADEDDAILAMKGLSALATGNATTMRQHLREFQKYIRGSNTALACEALRALSHLYPIVPFDKTAENLETYRLRAFDSIFADVEKLLFQLLLSDDGSDAATHWYNGVRNAVHLVFGLSSEVDFLISRITGKAFWYAKRSADVVLAYADFGSEKETAISYRKRREYLYRKWQQMTERTLMLVGEVVEALIVHITGSFPREMKRVADMNEILRQSPDGTEENYGGFDENRSEIETDFAYENGLFNLRPTHDEDIEIVATIFPGGGALEPKREPFSEVEPSDDAVQRNTERTTSSTSVSDEEKQQENPSTVDDLIRTHLNRLMESSLLKPYTSLGICLTFVVSYMRNSKYPKPIRDAAVRTFSTFLLISPAVAERGAPFLFAVLSSDPDPHIREYLLTSAVDLLHRFPSMMESCALFLYRMASDEDVSVRLTTVLWLTRLICNDMIKPRGSLSDVALCMITRESRETNRSSGRELAAAANKLFKELSKKGNLLLNVLPDIICRLARYGKEVSMAEFQTLVRRLLEMVGDKPHDIMVEKMCQRFDICSSEEAIKDNEKIAEYFSFFISQLTLSEKSLPKMHSFLPQFAPLLNNDVFFNDLISVIQSFLDSEPNAIARESADDLLRKVNFLHRKSLNEEERKDFLKSIGSADHENAAKGADDEEVAFTFDKCDQPVEYENS